MFTYLTLVILISISHLSESLSLRWSEMTCKKCHVHSFWWVTLSLRLPRTKVKTEDISYAYLLFDTILVCVCVCVCVHMCVYWYILHKCHVV